MQITEQTKDMIRDAMQSHQHCIHGASLCYALILCEVELVRNMPLEEDEIDACRRFIADHVLEGLILKGLVEPVGLNDEGDFLLGLTAAGEEAEAYYRKEDSE